MPDFPLRPDVYKRQELVILDIMMPGTDGLAVCRELRSVSDIPIILLTAKDSELDYVMGISQGSDCLLYTSSVNTTRIYTMETGRQHMKLLERVSRTLLT